MSKALSTYGRQARSERSSKHGAASDPVHVRGHRAGRSLAAAAVALGLVWLTAPDVPLYDGVGFPDEPYRYVQPPPGARATKPPTSTSGHVTAAKGTSNDFFDAPSEEKGPQVEVYASAGGLTGAPGVRGFDVRADPIAPGPATPGLTIDGNVYRLKLSSTPPGPVALAPVTDQIWVWIALRAVAAAPHGPTFVYRAAPGDPWRIMHTEQTGNDVFATNVVGAGDYALAHVRQAAGGPSGSGRAAGSHRSGGGIPLTVIVLGVTLGIIVVVVGGVRMARSRAR